MKAPDRGWVHVIELADLVGGQDSGVSDIPEIGVVSKEHV
jgi:hypothetical protein